MTQSRPEFFRFHNGDKGALPFAAEEYAARLTGLRAILEREGVDAAVLTSMHSIAYYSGFLYCAFGRPYALVVTASDSVVISAGIDAGQPWRRCHGDTITYTDWARDNYWRAIRSVTGEGAAIGAEGDHLTLVQRDKLGVFLSPSTMVDIAPATMRQRMHKSAAEIALIRAGAAVADIGGYAIREAVCEGIREIDVAMAGRNAMELEIAKRFPDAEYRDTWVWFQSGLNTDGAHNPVTGRRLERGDILSLNTFPMICGYYTALERTMFVGEVDEASLAIWEANVAAHELGMSLITARGDVFRDHGRGQCVFCRAGSAAVSLVRVWAFVRDSVALLWPRGGVGVARGCRHGAGAGDGDLDGADADCTDGDAGGGGLPRA